MKHRWRERIRREFGAPAKVVIISYAESNYSKRLTAAAIGITLQTLIAYCRKENIVFCDRINQRPECKAHGKGWPKGVKRK